MKNPREQTHLSGMKAVFMTVILFCTALASSLKLAAQSVPDKVDVDINTGSDPMWYGQPWVWAVGVAVFIVIIVAITRRGNKNA